jgi:hypothetical protein
VELGTWAEMYRESRRATLTCPSKHSKSLENRHASEI